MPLLHTHTHTKKRTTTTKLFVKPLKKEGAKSNKKTANFWAKNQNNGLKKKKDTSAPLPLVL